MLSVKISLIICIIMIPLKVKDNGCRHTFLVLIKPQDAGGFRYSWPVMENITDQINNHSADFPVVPDVRFDAADLDYAAWHIAPVVPE